MFGFVWKQGEGGAVTAALLRAVGRQWRAIRTEALQVLQRQQSSAPGALAATVREGEGLHERGQVRKQVFGHCSFKNDHFTKTPGPGQTQGKLNSREIVFSQWDELPFVSKNGPF